MSEKENDIVYNTQVVVGPEGYIGKQWKLHMSRDEALFYKGGREVNVFDLGKCKVGIVICYDNQFPEVARIVALKGAGRDFDAPRGSTRTLGRHVGIRSYSPEEGLRLLRQQLRHAGTRKCLLLCLCRPGRQGGLR